MIIVFSFTKGHKVNLTYKLTKYKHFQVQFLQRHLYEHLLYFYNGIFINIIQSKKDGFYCKKS